MKEIINISNEVAASVGVKLSGGKSYEAEGSLAVKDRKIGEFVATVQAVSDKQARFAICAVIKKDLGVGVLFTKVMVNGVELSQERVTAMNTHHAAEKETEEKTKMNKIKKIALVGETVNYTVLAEALKTEGKKLLVGDALNKNHLNALFMAKGGSFEGVMVQAYLAHQGETAAYSPEKLGFKPVVVSILSSMSNGLRAQLMKEALTNKASVLVGNAPEPTAPKPQPASTPAPKPEPQSTPTTEEVKSRVSVKLVELGQELEKGADVVAEINKFGSYAIQSLSMSEAEVNALIQKGIADAEEARKVQEKGIVIPDEEYVGEQDKIEAPVNEKENIVNIVSSMMEGSAGSSADIVTYFLSHNVDKEEDTVRVAKDILGLFSEVHSASLVEGELVIKGTILRDGNIHEVAVNSELQRRILE